MPRHATKLFALLALFSAAQPVAAGNPGNAALPTLFIIGDSTVNNSGHGLQGWGAPIAYFFDRHKIGVENRAIGGRSSRSFLTEGRWDKVMADLKPGDFVLMQLGHNDSGSLTEGRARASLKGIGDETQAVTNAGGAVEIVHTYGWYMRKYVRDTKARGATPIMVTLIPRNDWQDGRIPRSDESYAGWARASRRAGTYSGRGFKRHRRAPLRTARGGKIARRHLHPRAHPYLVGRRAAERGVRRRRLARAAQLRAGAWPPASTTGWLGTLSNTTPRRPSSAA